MATKGNIYFGLEIEGHRAPSAFRSKKIENKNYFKENFKKLRQMQKNKQQNECTQPVKALWKSSKYENVESKLKEQLENMFGHSAASRTNRNFLRAHSRTGFISASARGSSPARNKNESEVSSRALTARDMGKNVDYIKLNGCAIKRYSLKKSPSLGNLDIKQNIASHLPGQIPQYLIDRRNQWSKEEEDRRKKLKEAEIPSGHRLMSEQERTNTLEKARQKHKELSSQLGCLPLRNDTTRIRAIKDELETKLSEVEQSMKKLSKPKVYVVLES